MSPSFQAGHALLIGAGADLPFTIDDARGIADILKDPERCAYPASQVELLVGESAHRQAVLDALDHLAEAADESSTVVVYFSGHGYHATTPIGDAYFLIPFGVQKERLKDTAISGSEFASRLQAIRSRKLLLLLDCCHAGGIGLAKGLELAKSPLPPEALEILKQGKGRVITASCKESELSYGGKPYSAFTLALIEALSGQGASKLDGFVRAADLAMYAREKVPGRTKGRQHPILHFEEADNFVLAYYSGGETEPKGLPFTQEPEIEPEPGAWSRVFDQRGQTVHGPQTNIAGNVNEPVLSGQFSGPVALGGEEVDMRGSMGASYKPTYNINIPKAEEIPSIPTIPDPPSDFTGREAELKELKAKFAGGTNIIGLRGIGGVGKTVLAFKLAESLKDRYPDGQILVEMRGTSDNPTSPSEAMGFVIHAYHPNEKLSDNEAEIKGRYSRLLNGKHALLLLDNALDDRQSLKLIPPKTCGLLITSRKAIKLPGLFRKDLYVLEPEEALELLLKVRNSTSDSLDPPEDDSAWSEIARLCGFLPLALRAAASYLANAPDISPIRYAEELKEERTRLEKIGDEGVELGVDASFNLSLQRLDAKTQQTFLDASVFPADFDGQAEEHICQDVGHKSLSELMRWSLVDYKLQGPDYGRYKLHDLARLFALARQSVESKAIIQERHSAYYKELLSAADDLYLKGGSDIQAGLALFDREWANIRVGQFWTESQISRAKDISREIEPVFRLCKDYSDAGVYVLNLRLHPAEKIRWFEASLKAAHILKDRQSEGVHLGNLGSTYYSLGDSRKAIEYYEKALAIDRDIGDKRNEDAWLGNLGLAYADLGDSRKALEYYEQALAIDREIGDRRGEGHDLGNMGLAYLFMGDARKAIEYSEQRLAIAREMGDRSGEGIALDSLGSAYCSLSDARKAIEFYEQALVIAREIGDRRGEGNALGNMGSACYNQGDAPKAIEYFEQALAIACEIGDRRCEGLWLGNMGMVYSDLGEFLKAIKYCEQALAIAHEIGNRREEGANLGGLGLAYADLGDTRKAVEYFEQALAIAREIRDRRGEGNALWNMSRVLDQLGQRAKAIDCAKSALKIREEIEDPHAEKIKRKLQEWEK